VRYEVALADRVLRVEIDGAGRFLVDDRVVALDAVEIERGRHWSVTLDGGSHEIVALTPDRLLVDGIAVAVTVTDERAIAAGRSGGGVRSQRREVRAPMPGLLKAVHVREGDVVEEGAALATLEAMKMENELRAPLRSRVVSVSASAGAKVEGGALLMILGETD